MPSCLQQRLLLLSHKNHFGISKSKARLRRSYWWPAMDNDVERAGCNFMLSAKTPRESPAEITEWATIPWYSLVVDIAGSKYDCKGHMFYLVSLIDDHSRYEITQMLRSIRSNDIIQFLRNKFVYFGFFWQNNDGQWASNPLRGSSGSFSAAMESFTQRQRYIIHKQMDRSKE